MKKCISNGMDDYLASIGLWRKPTAKDGSSLFRAVAEQVYSTQALHLKVREECIRFLERSSMLPPRIAEHHIQKLKNPREWGGHIEINALSKLYCRDFIVYKDIGMPSNVTQNNYKKKVLLCFSNGHHYDSIYPRSYVESAKICQSIVYEILYKIFLSDPLKEAKKMIESEPNELVDSMDSLTLSGRDPDHFPFKVAKALSPDKYRNVELDTWKESRKENPHHREFYPVREFFFPGDKCQVKKNGHIYNAHIQDMSSDRGPVTVFIEELGVKDTVPYHSLLYLRREPGVDIKEKKILKKREICTRVTTTVRPEDKGKYVMGFRGIGPRLHINAAGHPVKRHIGSQWNQENFRGRFPAPNTTCSFNSEPEVDKVKMTESHNAVETSMNTFICENVQTMEDRGLEPVMMMQQQQPMNIDTPPMTPDLTVDVNHPIPPPIPQVFYPYPPQMFVPDTPPTDFPPDIFFYNLGLQTYLNNMIPNQVEEDVTHANGQLLIVKDSNNLVKTTEMANEGNAIKYGLVKNLNKLNLDDKHCADYKKAESIHRDTGSDCEQSKSLIRTACPNYMNETEYTENSSSFHKKGQHSVSSQDSGCGESDASSTGGVDIDVSYSLCDESVDSLDCHSDNCSLLLSSSNSSSPSNEMMSSSTSKAISSAKTALPLTHFKPYETKATQAAAAMQQMRPIPCRFRFLLDEEARKNPAQYPKRFEGQPLVRHKPLGNRKRKLARLAHLAYMMEAGSETQQNSSFEFNPDAECFQPRVNELNREEADEPQLVKSCVENISSGDHLVKSESSIKDKNDNTVQEVDDSTCNTGEIIVKNDVLKMQNIASENKNLISNLKSMQTLNNNISLQINAPANVKIPTNNPDSSKQIIDNSNIANNLQPNANNNIFVRKPMPYYLYVSPGPESLPVQNGTYLSSVSPGQITAECQVNLNNSSDEINNQTTMVTPVHTSNTGCSQVSSPVLSVNSHNNVVPVVYSSSSPGCMQPAGNVTMTSSGPMFVPFVPNPAFQHHQQQQQMMAPLPAPQQIMHQMAPPPPGAQQQVMSQHHPQQQQLVVPPPHPGAVALAPMPAPLQQGAQMQQPSQQAPPQGTVYYNTVYQCPPPPPPHPQAYMPPYAAQPQYC